MSKAEWGNKRTCPHCKARFYDLNRNPVSCPKCHTEFGQDRARKAKGTKPGKEEVAAPVPEVAEGIVDPVEEDVDELDELDDVEDVDVDLDDDVDFDVDAADNPMIEGADDLDDDDDVPAFVAGSDDEEG